MGLTSRAGVIPVTLLADIAGPMARTVEDAARLFQVIAGPDPDDAVTAAARSHPPEDYMAALVPDGLRGAVIGVLRQAFESPTADPEVIGLFTKAVEDMRGAGARMVDPAMVDGLDQIKRPPEAGQCMGFKYYLNRYLASQGDLVPVKSLAEIIKSGRFHPSVQRRLERSEAAPENGPDSVACRADASYREAVRQAVLRTMDKFKLDAFVYPTWSNPPRLIGDLNTPDGDNNQFFSPTTGFPAINVPMGFTRGGTLPAGMTIYGRAWSDAMLIKLAYSYESHTHHRRPPSSTPPVG